MSAASNPTDMIAAGAEGAYWIRLIVALKNGMSWRGGLVAFQSDAGFVIPYFRATELHERFLAELVDCLTAQTVPGWRAAVVVDGPESRLSDELADRLRRDGRFTLFEMPRRIGPGPCRNLATRWCLDAGADFIFFQDADDMPHPERVAETIAVFSRRKEVDFVYSAFDPIDEDGNPMPDDAITPLYLECIKALRGEPVEGPNAWITIGTETGFVTLTSTVAVRAPLAAQCMFPAAPVSQDCHTFYRMSAAGSAFARSDFKFSKYRMRKSSGGGSIFTRFGDAYYMMKSQVDLDGFSTAMRIALSRGTLSPDQAGPVMRKFYERLAQTMDYTGDHNAADLLRGFAVCA
ncbi:glycosyltransferase family A protein [Phytohabitans sp. ZYX-F-186]|uniref:Glycosyltransferase family A protein n=1 Tax=Phytohabitans maris TaxID=3071409 RepID=A0ABU0ZFW6_9ACTN|nr:glycosyltransferase family A protein [Phytohabitans sp. ZYX-F-186]MDQ7905953.1 glycosyltransferase family A protein [Phytohabitans sp. ZYX-F-186]